MQAKYGLNRLNLFSKRYAAPIEIGINIRDNARVPRVYRKTPIPEYNIPVRRMEISIEFIFLLISIKTKPMPHIIKKATVSDLENN